MFRAPRLVGAASLGRFSRRNSGLPVPAFSEVKFQKEDVAAVMAELPEFNFYEMKEPVPNPYKGVTLDRSVLLDPVAPATAAPVTQFSKLENGLKIASVDKQGLTARLSLFVNAGSRYEDASNFGVSHMVSLMAYKSTAHLSHLRTVKTLEQLGANHASQCTAGREEIVYSVDVMREYVPMVIPLMVGNVLFPRLLPWEVKAAHAKVKEAQAALEGDADAMVSELLHRAAYCNNTLGRSPLASERSMGYFTPETIRSFMLDHFAPENMVLVGVNVAHEELTKWAMRSFVDYNAIPRKDRSAQKAEYTGGDTRREGSSPYCHLAIGLESAAWGSADLATVAVLQALLGAGGAAAGEGTVSPINRLSTQIVNQNPYVESCSAFNTSYSDSGLFGVYTVCDADHAGDVATAVVKSLTGLTSVTEDELNLAKAALKGRLHRQADEDATLVQDFGQQLLFSGRYGSPADLCAIVDGVTTAQVGAAATKMLSSRPTVAAYGSTHAVPHYAAIEAAFGTPAALPKKAAAAAPKKEAAPAAEPAPAKEAPKAAKAEPKKAASKKKAA